MKKLIYPAVALSLFFASCSSDDDAVIDDQNIDIPSNYVFERGGESTVQYKGQTTRLQMTAELVKSFMDFDTATEESLLNMFAHEKGANDFENSDLNASGKNIKSKTAASATYFSTNAVESAAIKADFESFISQQVNVVFPNENTVAEPGVAGQVADGSKVRYVDGKGLENNQAFAKGMMGALLADQMLNNYLSTAVLDEATNREDNDNNVLDGDNNYTTMEHKWDEAYGYLYGDPSIPTANPNSVLGDSDDRLLFGYLGVVNSDDDFAGLAQTIFDAFKTGRAAIVAGDYQLRDEQIDIIKEGVSTIIAVRAIHYLQAGKNAIAEGNVKGSFHALSEGYGFLYSLRFTQNPATGAPYVSPAEINEFKTQLMARNGFWDVTPETLDNISEAIASAFNFTVAEAAN
ncbi:DUF4856 domain-containing protein [Marixanthomonas spongiae]|uniref:DUF4856 domain-containing protein n=1 Tax=Marixanthomonas spongiae TaxID=2174845 RepID=A0A2U0HW49_9FLAO|nr:DUF4856 domain-containing protein [Marixanthomonas spongiae]PVW13092.1 DUF4856 domain-containing protein [Marixanthomonas spongiae]